MSKIKKNNAIEIKEGYKAKYHSLYESSDLSELNAIKSNLKEDKEHLQKIISKGISDFKNSLIGNDIPVNRLMKIVNNALQDELSFINHYDNHLIDDLRNALNKMNEYPEHHLIPLHPAIDAHKELRKIILEVEAIREVSQQVKTDKFHGDKRETQGEKEEIKKYWGTHKEKYLTGKYKFISSGYYNKTKIAKDIKEDGKFNSHIDTIIDHAGLDDLE